MEESLSRPLLEGLGNEVFVVLFSFLAILLSSIFWYYRWAIRRAVNDVIHPDSENQVRQARDNLPEIREAVRSGQGVGCPVCLATTSFGIETNCGHIFCGACIIAYWRYGSWLGSVKCPVCRQQVTTLLLLFTDTENQIVSDDKSKILKDVKQYNRRFSGESVPWREYISEAPTLLRHAIRDLFTLDGLVWIFRMRIGVCTLCALVYLISPLDIVPEALFGIFGFFDDLFIIVVVLVYVSILYRQYLGGDNFGGAGNRPEEVNG